MPDRSKELYYSTNASIHHTEEEFRLTLASQENTRSYALHPKHAKRLLLLLTSHINEYERKFGTLKTDLPTSQLSDLAGNKFGFRFPTETENKESRQLKRVVHAKIRRN